MHRKNKPVVGCWLLAVGLMAVLSFFTSPAFAAESSKGNIPAPPKEPIIVNGDNVEYFQEKKMVVGTGNVSIKYKDIFLTCNKITVYLDTREAIAEGNVRVTQKGAYFTGERMNYNFETKKGTVLKGYINAKPFYGRAEDVGKIENKEQFKLDDGYITTCDLEKPHYRVRAKQIMLYLGDKVIARHIFMYVGNVPVLYWPYYVQPLKERKSHITIIPGTRSGWGYYALTSYRYYIDNYNKGDILLDYRTKKGIAEGINHYYETQDLGKGAVKLYYTRENAFVYQTTSPEVTRYRWQVRHQWDMGEGTDTIATLEFNKMSDTDMIKDYFYDEYEELGATPDNYITFITQKEAYSTQFLIRKRMDNFLDVVDRLPEYSITIPDTNIAKKVGIYYKANASAGYLNHEFNNTNVAVPPLKDIGSGRVDTFNQFSYPIRVLRTLSTTPYVAVEDTYYSRLATGKTNEIRNIFSGGLNNSVKFYKVYDVESNFLGLDINKLRHIITPTANYYYVGAPNINPSDIDQFDAIDALDNQTGVLFGIENRLQTKRRDEDGNLKSVDLVTLQINTNYMIRMEKDNLAVKHDRFDGFQTKLELIPYSWAYLEAELDTDPKTYEMQRSSIDLVSHWKDKWSVAVSERYENVQTGQNNLLTGDVTYKINDKWKVRAYGRYNTTTSTFEEQQYTLTRDLHCWIAELTYDLATDDSQNIWILFRLKAFPLTPIGLRHTYSHPRFGEAGTQQ